MEHLQGKCVLLCVSGGIAAYKIPNVASALRKAGAEVHVVMTRNATEFITPLDLRVPHQPPLRGGHF